MLCYRGSDSLLCLDILTNEENMILILMEQNSWNIYINDAAFSVGSSLVTQTVKSLPGMLETQVWSLGREDPLEKEMATHSSSLAGKSPWLEEPGGLQSMGLQRVRHNWAIFQFSNWPNTKGILHIPPSFSSIPLCLVFIHKTAHSYPVYMFV